MALKEKSNRRQYRGSEERTAKIFAPEGLGNKFQKSIVLDFCEEIYRCEMRGDLRQAIDLLAPYWTGFEGEIKIPSVNKIEAANLLLRFGSVISAYGSAEQIKNSQEKARECLSRAEAIFDDLDDAEGKAQCQNKTGVTYWRNGDLDTAQIYFRESLFYAQSNESKAIANLNLAMSESSNFRYSSALKFYETAYQFIGQISVFTEAKIRNGIGLVYKNIGKSLSETERVNYFDKAIIEFDGALICFEAVQNSRSAVLARNNIGFLYYSIGLYDEALRVLEIAETDARQTRDKDYLSVVSDTLARAFIAKGDFRRAVEVAADSVKYLESFESSNLLATALITYGIALARSGEIEKAKSVFGQAEEVAGFNQDFTLASAARLFALREMFFEYSPKERLSSYLYTVKNLSGSQEKDISDALAEVAVKIEPEIESPAQKIERKPPLSRQSFSLDEELKTISREYMEAAIREAGGNQSRAAVLLGMSRQTFVARVKKDFPDLFSSFSRKDKSVKKVQACDLPLINDEIGLKNIKDEKLALTEIQADYREIRQGDFLFIKRGMPDANTHIIIGDQTDEALKIGFFIKNESNYFLESADGDRFELNDAGKNRILGKVVGFCRRADFQRYFAERNEGRYCELTYETLKE
jgi:tetratricopeptide (TPR) repeat protein